MVGTEEQYIQLVYPISGTKTNAVRLVQYCSSRMLTALQVWVRIRTHFSLTFLPLDHTQSIPVGFNSLLATMKEETAIYNP